MPFKCEMCNSWNCEENGEDDMCRYVVDHILEKKLNKNVGRHILSYLNPYDVKKLYDRDGKTKKIFYTNEEKTSYFIGWK